MRKIYLKIKPNSSQDETDKFAAKFVDLISFGKFRAKAIITISNSNIRLWSSLNKNGKVFDMQHGIIYKNHPGYFDVDGGLYDVIKRPNVNILLWGKGYEDNIVRGDEEVLAGRTHIVGYPIPTTQRTNRQNEDHTIIVSLQFTHDIDEEGLKQDKRILADLLTSTEKLGYKVLLKHHPRFNNAINIDDLVSRYTHAELTNKSLDELVSKVRLHITYFSTTTFEYAQQGIPTYFLPSQGRELYELFYTEYNYPLYQGMEIGAVLTRLEDKKAYAADSATVYDWYERFYSPLDEKLFLELIR